MFQACVAATENVRSQNMVQQVDGTSAGRSEAARSIYVK